MPESPALPNLVTRQEKHSLVANKLYFLRAQTQTESTNSN